MYFLVATQNISQTTHPLFINLEIILESTSNYLPSYLVV